MGNEFEIESVSALGKVLTIVCHGSGGHPALNLIRQSIEGWMGKHPHEKLEEIVLDLAAVEYAWGDWPATSIMGFLRRGVRTFRLIANPQNRKSLENLVNPMRQIGFSVEERPSVS